ncbi:hypothetical protein [Roseovarius sp.]|uniref:hypothetical protein n=1 Tax=Roseovarius sp. TaxID=1486281 RepID=UPI003A986B9F
MSGGGGGGGDFRPPGGGTRSSCNIDEIVPVSSPDPNVVGQIRQGMPLEVVAATNPRRVIVVVQSSGETLGSLTWSGLAKLLQCMEDGHDYVASVHSVQNGVVQVRIENA